MRTAETSARLRQALESLDGLPVRFQVKLQGQSAPVFGGLRPVTETFCDSPWGPVALPSVEWLSVDPVERRHTGLMLRQTRTDHAGEVERRLQQADVPYCWQGAYIRIN